MHTRHAFTCTPTLEHAKNYGLQNGLCDLVLLFPGCCKFGLPVPLFCFISWCSSKPFRLPPSSSCPPFLNAFTAHVCRLHTHINICFAHIECHCKSRGVKTTRRQSVGPAQQGATQPARNVAFDDEAEAPSKMKGSVSVSLSSHTVPLHQHPQGTYNGQNKNLQEAYQTLYQFFAHFVVLDSAPRREHPCPPPA